MATPADDAASKKKLKLPKLSKKLLIIIIAGVLVLGGGGAGAYFMYFSGPSKPAAKPAPKPGKVVPLEAITLNLRDGHFLKIKLALQATADAKEAPDGSKALDITIATFSNLSVAELSSGPARETAKKELTKKITEAYKGEVYDIYFTEFVMQ
jgi:flagellar FliL protein